MSRLEIIKQRLKLSSLESESEFLRTTRNDMEWLIEEIEKLNAKSESSFTNECDECVDPFMGSTC